MTDKEASLRTRAFRSGMAMVIRCIEEGVPLERIKRAMRTLDPKPKPPAKPKRANSKRKQR